MKELFHSHALCARHSHCDYPGCIENHHKFGSCVTEALHSVSLDDGETTGDVEAFGHFTALSFDAPEDIELDDRTITVPAGYYLVSSDSQGFVRMSTYDTKAEMDADFKAEDTRYGEWLGEDDD